MVLVKDNTREMRSKNFLKPCPLISEKLVFGCALFSNVESDIAAEDHDRDDPTGKVQRQGLAEDKVYLAHKMPSTCTYPARRGEGGGATEAPCFTGL